MDQAIERLLATPKTTALRPCRSEDMDGSWEWERITGEEKTQKSQIRMLRMEKIKKACRRKARRRAAL
jgi:hypothetical protein